MDRRNVINSAMDIGLITKGGINYDNVCSMWIRDYHYLKKRVSERMKQMYSGGGDNG